MAAFKRMFNWGCVEVLTMLLQCGCGPHMGMAWSPDGSKAALQTGDGKTILIDADGKQIATVGESVSLFAWNNDSTVLYYVTNLDSAQVPPSTIIHKGSNVRDALFPPPTTHPTSAPALFEMKKGQTSRILTGLGSMGVSELAMSPDGQWLAMLASTGEKNSSIGGRLIGYHLPSGELYVFDTSVWVWGLCFTGPHRVAYGQITLAASNAVVIGSLTNVLTEVELDNSSEAAKPQARRLIVPQFMQTIQPAGDDILFTSPEISFPSRISDEPFPTLFRLRRADDSLIPIARHVLPGFMPSPDGRHILFEQTIYDEEDKKWALPVLAIATADGKTVRILRGAEDNQFGRLFWPIPRMWRGNDQITLLTPSLNHKEEGAGAPFDVVLYRLKGDYTLEQIRVLSESWQKELLPRARFLSVTTQPTTRP